MKTNMVRALVFGVVLTGSCLAGLSLFAQNAGPASAGHRGQSQPVSTAQVIKRGPDQNILERLNPRMLPSGRIVTNLNHFVEISTGLNHIDKNGQWVASKEEIVILANGTAAATNGEHQAFFPGDIYRGVIQLVTRDGKQLKSRPLGLFLDDGTNTVLIASLTNAMGYLVGSNQVIYPDAFTGVKADLRYTYKKSGFEQDIVLREQPPAPESYGLNPTNARLQVLTEFFNPPEPQQRRGRGQRNGMGDTTLTFGQMRMSRGRAFSIGDDSGAGKPARTSRTSAAARHGGVAVNKSWQHLGGRTFLVEEVPYQGIAPQLDELPAAAGGQTSQNSTNSILSKVSATRLLPSAEFSKSALRTPHSEMIRQLASAGLNQKPGVVLDYVALNGSAGDYTFQAGTTYFISGPLYCNNVTIEGGAVIKYPNDTTAYIEVDGTLTCQTGPYRPAVFTAADDNSVGECMSGVWGGYTGTIQSGGYANPALLFRSDSLDNPPVGLKNVRIKYAQAAIQVEPQYETANNGYGATMTDCQIMDSVQGIVWKLGDWNSITMNNCLMANLGCLLVDNGEYYPSYPDYLNSNGGGTGLYLNNCTIDNSVLVENYFFYNYGGVESDGYGYGFSCHPDSLIAINSIFANDILTDLVADDPSINGSGINNGFYLSDHFGDGQVFVNDLPFQAVGGGGYYLTDDTFRNRGQSAMDSGLLADLATKTTRPPVERSNITVSTDTTWSPQTSLRDTGNLDWGYHYDPIDYALRDIQVTGSKLTIAPGTVITAFATNDAGMYLHIGTGANLVCKGTPSSPIWVVAYNAVQEQVATNWILPSGWSGGLINGGSPCYRFTDWSALSPNVFLVDNYNYGGSLAFRDCEFYGGSLSSSYQLGMTNCLLAGVNLYVESYPVVIRNNLFLGGTFDVNPSYSVSTIKDNLFDQTGIIPYTEYLNSRTNDHNGYVNGYDRLQPTSTSDVILGSSPAYQAGPLGNYYLPSDSPLINAGSTTANLVGLYHYTTQTSQVKEANSAVDIGYHYVATDANGNPIDTDGDGGPDYYEDSNGNGIYDAGDISDWLVNCLPVANDSSAVACLNTSATIPLSGSDSCNGSLTYIVVSGPSHGVLNGGTGPSQVYTPATGYSGSDSFTFKVNNGVSDSTPATVSLTVEQPQGVPIVFWLSATNLYVNQTTVPLQISLAGGDPAYIAIMVNDTNYADANWQAYTGTNITVTLGATDGVYKVWVGLRGQPVCAQQAWNTDDVRFTLDRVPPSLVITNPLGATNAVVIKPYLQLQGFGNEPLLSISYDITNALGLVTNLNGFVTDQLFDTNNFDKTTNYFQCYDIHLTNGLNRITLRCADRASNVTTTNINVTLDYSTATNPPVVSLIWPQDGMAVSGPSTTIRGTMSDETGTIEAQVMNGDGTTNTIAGLVERNRMFWVENVPLNGTSLITLQATDAAGNMTTTNFTLPPAPVQLTIKPVSGDLYQPTVSVSGTASAQIGAVMVNGVVSTSIQQNSAGTWNWSADNVPVYGGGTATFDVEAYAPGAALPGISGAGGSASPTSNATLPVEKPAAVEVVQHTAEKSLEIKWDNGRFYETWHKEWDAQFQTGIMQDYTGSVNDHRVWHNSTGSGWTEIDYGWDELGEWTEVSDNTGYYSSGPGIGDDEFGQITGVPDEDVSVNGQAGVMPPCFVYHYYANGVDHPYPLLDPDGVPYGTGEVKVDAHMKVKLFTGGKAAIGRQNLFCINAWAIENGTPPNWMPWTDTPGHPIPPQELTVMGKMPDANGNVWIVLPDNSEQDMTVFAPRNHYDAWATQQKYHCYFTAFVDMPGPPPSHVTHIGISDWGHAWWCFSSDAPGEALIQFGAAPEQIHFVNEQVGYASIHHVPHGDGWLRDPETDSKADETRTYDIGFDDLLAGLSYTEAIQDSPGKYDIFFNNCVQHVVAAGCAAGVTLPNDTRPETFGWDLINSQ